MSRTSPPNYYAILGVTYTAGEVEIRSAYRRLVKQYHPDLHEGAEAQRRIREINNAYQVLSDPARRRRYDMQLFLGADPANRWHSSNSAHAQPSAARPHRRPNPMEQAARQATERQWAAAKAARQRAREADVQPTTWREHLPVLGVVAIILTIGVYFFFVHKHVVIPHETTRLNRNGYTELPAGLRGQRQIQNLYLQSNSIRFLDTFLLAFDQLRYLNLNANKLEALPQNIHRLRALRELHLRDNRLTSLPDNILKLNNLHTLDLAGNPLLVMPDSLHRLAHLKRLILAGTELTQREQARIRYHLPDTEIYYNRYDYSQDTNNTAKELQ